MSEGQIVPYFQPIVSVESGLVAGVEALGRHLINSEVRSLGPFFEIDTRDRPFNELRREVDRTLRMAALRMFAAHSAPGVRLFINITPRLMLQHLEENPDGLPWTLAAMAEIGLDPNRVVIELTEEAVGAETVSLRRLVDVYRSHGCGIALDDVGAESSNLDRVGLFEPDIIKVDAAMLRRSLRDNSFRHVLKGVGAMAEGLGAWLLFEGVETEAEFDQALGFGARYVQGWHFAKAEAGFVAPDAFLEVVRGPLERFGERETAKAEALAERLDDAIVRLGDPPTIHGTERPLHIDERDLDRWSSLACRVFVTDRSGFQISPNYVWTEKGWNADYAVVGRFRAVRPYFPGPDHPQLGGSAWTASVVYFDVNDQRPMRTFGRPINGGLFVFIDVLEIEKPT